MAAKLSSRLRVWTSVRRFRGGPSNDRYARSSGATVAASSFRGPLPAGLVVMILLGACTAPLQPSTGAGSDGLRAGAGVESQVAPVAEADSPPLTAVTATLTPTVTPTPERSPTHEPSPNPQPSPTPTVTPTPTPHPLQPYTIEGLRERDYPAGMVRILTTQERNEAYTRYYIAYPSDDLTITGIMQVPHGEGPFPVVVLNHGYIRPSRYWSGADTWRVADYLARRGFLTLAPDFRGWGGSDSGDNFFRTGIVTDALNLLSSVPSIPQADPDRIGMWGHSMGGGLTTKAITVDPRIKAAVLYAPVSADDRVTMRRWGGGSGRGDDRGDVYGLARPDPAFLRLTSPIFYFQHVTAPVQIHQGTADTTTPPEWAEAIRDALQAAGRDVESFSYAGQGHAFQGESWSLFLRRIAAFFQESL